MYRTIVNANTGNAIEIFDVGGLKVTGGGALYYLKVAEHEFVLMPTINQLCKTSPLTDILGHSP